jgi:hypothetical protein
MNDFARLFSWDGKFDTAQPRSRKVAYAPFQSIDQIGHAVDDATRLNLVPANAIVHD